MDLWYTNGERIHLEKSVAYKKYDEEEEEVETPTLICSLFDGDSETETHSVERNVTEVGVSRRELEDYIPHLHLSLIHI